MTFKPFVQAVLVAAVFVSAGSCKTAPASLPASFSKIDGTPVEKRIEMVTGCINRKVILKDDPTPCPDLKARMEQLRVHGVSIAVVHNGAIDWARGFGMADVSGKPVTPETLFQAGSISKPVAAMAALRLVDQKKLSLDKDVNLTLSSWKIPASDAAPGATVTLRELLTHTAGFTVHGFPGYAAGAPVPTLVQVLNGEKPANTAPIRLESPPGTIWNYSGGGYTVMQQLVLDVAKEPFPKLLHDTVLVPLGMSHSTYEQPLPEPMRANAAVPYDAQGNAIAGGAHTYPEMAAAGLWTTPSDLAHYILANQQSLAGKDDHVLSTAMTEEMMKYGKGNWGLGLQIGGDSSNRYFSHGGVNAGFESLFVAYEQNGEGAVVMTNAQGGSQLAEEIMGSIAKAYGWPDFQPEVRASVAVDPAVLAQYAGKYEISPNFIVTIAPEKGHLSLQPPGFPPLEFYAESPTKFFAITADLWMEFFKDEKGAVSYFISHEGTHESKAMKK